MNDRRPFHCLNQRKHARREGRQGNENPEERYPIPVIWWSGVRLRVRILVFHVSSCDLLQNGRLDVEFSCVLSGYFRVWPELGQSH